MSKPLTVPDIVCSCGRRVDITHAQLRTWTDAGLSAKCNECRRTRLPLKPRSQTALVAIAVKQVMVSKNEASASVEDVTIAVWTTQKKRFGLRGYETAHPDKQRVVRALVQAESMGLLRRVAEGRYQTNE